MTTGELVKLRTPPMRLRPGEEYWTDYRHQLLARLRTEARRGTVQPVALREIAPGFYGALVVRLKPRPPRWRKPAMAAVAAVPLVAGAAMLAVELAQWAVAYAGPVLLLLAAGWGMLRALSGHRIVCIGLHCPGCRH